MAILLLLQLRSRLTAAELAAEFEVTQRTIYRDIDALSAAGVPVYGDRGPGGGFSLLDGYRTQLTGLDTPEAEALPLLGLSSLARSLGIGPAVESARRKLLATLNVAGRENAERTGSRFHFDATDWYSASEPLPYLRPIAQAVFEARTASITYQSWKGVRHWDVEPLGIVFKSGNWYLAANCNGNTLTFKVASILSCVISEAQFDRPIAFDLAAYWADSSRRFEERLKSKKAMVRATAEGRRRLVETGLLDPSGLDPQCGQTDVEIRAEADDMTSRQILYIGDEVEVIRPASLRRAVAALAIRMADRHRATP